jgi:hypothetical protein
MNKLSQINWARVLRPQAENLQGMWASRSARSRRPLERTPDDLLAVTGVEREEMGEEAALAYLTDAALRKLDNGIAELLQDAFGEPVALGV